jgi:5-methylcytosine-specific restriction endonuclease McrA
VQSVLEESVLVLNKYYLAIHVCTARDILQLLVTGKAEVLDEQFVRYSFEEWAGYTVQHPEVADRFCGIIHSPSVRCYVPNVVRLNEYDLITSHLDVLRYTRKNLFDRDGMKCQYCLREFVKSELTVDHVVPRSKGGMSTWTNVVTSCHQCNNLKGNKTLEELGWKLPRKPGVPKWKSNVRLPFHKAKREAWKTFLR